MNIEIDSEYKKLCYIRSIKPGHLRISAILILMFLTLLTLGIPLLAYWKWQRFRNLVHLIIFNQVQEDSAEISHYLITDSLKKQGKSRFRNMNYRNWIVSPYHIEKQSYQKQQFDSSLCKYIEHKNLRYVIRNNNLESAKLRIHKDLEDYVRDGLTADQLVQSHKIFGEAGSFKINFFHIFKKIFHQKRLRYVFMMFAVKKIIFEFFFDYHPKHQGIQIVVSIVILVEIVLTLSIMLGISIFCAKQHNQINGALDDKEYKVVRKGQKNEGKPVKLKDLRVGDVVELQKQPDQAIFFKGILSTNSSVNGYTPFCVVNEKLFNRKDISVYKTPLVSHKASVQQVNTINPGSVIVNMGLQKISSKKKTGQQNKENEKKKQKQSNQNEQLENQSQIKFFVIVSDNNYLQKFYESYKEISYYDNLESCRISYDRQQFFFHVFFAVLAFIGSFLVSKDVGTNQKWISIILSIVILCFPFNLAFFCSISQIISIARFKMKNISVVNPVIQEIGLIDNLSAELSCYESFQYRGFIKRSQCNGLPEPLMYENKQGFFDAYRRTRDDSFYAYLCWIGIFNRPYFKKQQIYEKMSEDFGFQIKQNEYDDTNTPRITNSYKHVINIDWQEIQRFKISGMLLQSSIIKNHYPDRPDRKFLSITLGEFTSEECYAYFDQLIHERGTQQWKDVIHRLHSQCKKVHYLCCKKMHAEDDSPYPTFSRISSQTNSQFMGLIVFDSWPNAQKMRDLLSLDQLQHDQENAVLSTRFFSIQQQNSLIGYDHIIRNTKIYHSLSASLRTEQILISKPDYQGLLHIGNGILDQGSLLVSDISVSMISQSVSQADLYLTQTKQVFEILNQGSWALQNTTLTVVCSVLFNFSKIIGYLVLFQGDNLEKEEQIVPLFRNYDKLIIQDFGMLMIPIFLVNLYEPAKKAQKKIKAGFFKLEILYNTLIALTGLAILYTIEFIDHGFKGTCQIYQNRQLGRYLIELREASHHDAIFSKAQNCEGVVDFISISFGLLTILLLDRESPQRKARSILIAAINKVYMFLLWITTLIIFHISWKQIIRAVVMILLVLTLALISEYFTKKKNPFKFENPEEKQQAVIEQTEVQEVRQRARRRLRSYKTN